jgi:hypothetical protein
VSDQISQSRFWTLYQDFFLGYHAASRCFSKKKDPRRGGGPIKTVDQYSAVPYLHYRTGRGAWYLSVSTE